MRKLCLAALAFLALPAFAEAPAASTDAAIAPPQAIAIADATPPGRGKAGRFVLPVASTGHTGGVVFLNSSSDYRAPDDLTFRLEPNVVAALTRRYGASPETFLRGKTVIVEGSVRRVLIVDSDDYLPRHVLGADRWQHVVRVLLPHQVVSVE